jgi:phosphoribosylanthranilate isomerase
MLVKICGITKSEDALGCARAGADMVGFVFAPSPRKVEAREARRIASPLPVGISKVGVFLDQPLDEVLRACSLAGLDYIQLHGRETPEFCNRVHEMTGAGIIKAVQMGTREDLSGMGTYDLESVSFILLDSPKNGKTPEKKRKSPWMILGGPPPIRKPYFVAGGLTAENVGEAIRKLSPAGVDVSSGVESSPGVKDLEKVRRFISEAKSQTPG